MLRAMVRAAETLVLALVAYDVALATRGWTVPPPAPPGSRSRRFRVVVPAHDEEQVIAGVLGDLAAQDYEVALRRCVVIADRCTDGTVARAEGAAEVVERWEGEPGKGPALHWYLTKEPLEPGEALVVLDADTRVPANLLAGFADELDAGHRVLQAYLDVTNPDESLLSTASAVSYWAGNRMVQVARRNLGWSADLGGTGMCLTPEALAAAGGFGATLTEDRELALRLLLAGETVVWVHHLRIHDEKPTGIGVALRQRARWRTGTGQVRREHLLPVLSYALTHRSGGAFDHALRLVRPTRSMLVLLSAVLLGASATPAGRMLSRRRWAAALAVQVGLPPVFLRRDGVPARYLRRYPFVVLFAVASLPVRVLSRRMGRQWFHTPHTGRSGGPT